jgi:4-hydroxybenzoate polyprenyltransferase
MIGLTKNKAVLVMILLTFVLSALAILSTFMTTAVALVMYLGIACGAILFAMLVIAVDMNNYHKVVRRKK